MFHMLVCAPDTGACDCVLDSIADYLSDYDEQLDIIAREDYPNKLYNIAKSNAFSLLTLIETVKNEHHLQNKISLATISQEQNRDNQLLLVLENLQHLIPFVNENTKPSGVIIPSAGMSLNKPLIEGIVDRFRNADVAPSDVLILKIGNGTRRLQMSDLIYVEACGKHINLYTRLQCISIIGSLKDMKERLGEGFLQSHRSYLVNKAYITGADYTALTLHLINHMEVPIARTQKNEVKAYMNGGM